MQESEGEMKKQPEIKASPLTKKAVRFFNEKASATDLLVESGDKKLKFSGYTRTLNDKIFDFIGNREVGKWLALALVTAMIVGVAYWGIKQ